MRYLNLCRDRANEERRVWRVARQLKSRRNNLHIARRHHAAGHRGAHRRDPRRRSHPSHSSPPSPSRLLARVVCSGIGASCQMPHDYLSLTTCLTCVTRPPCRPDRTNGSLQTCAARKGPYLVHRSSFSRCGSLRVDNTMPYVWGGQTGRIRT